MAFKKLTYMFNVSEGTADVAYTVSNIVLVIGAVMALVGTAVSVWSGAVRERYSNIKLSDNVAATANANNSAAEAHERAAKLEKEAAIAKLELEQIKAKQLPRIITKQQAADFVAALGSSPRGRIEIIRRSQSAECTAFAVQIADLMARSGFTRQNPINEAIIMGGDKTSLYLGVFNTQDAPPHAKFIQHAFSTIGIKASAAQGTPNGYVDAVVVWVGDKE